MAKVKIRPLGDKVLVKRVEAESTTAGGIVLPEAAKEKPKRGIVQAIGDGRLLDSGERSKLQLSKGDEVIFSSYAGTEIKVGSDELLIIGESEILAVVDLIPTRFTQGKDKKRKNISETTRRSE